MIMIFMLACCGNSEAISLSAKPATRAGSRVAVLNHVARRGAVNSEKIAPLPHNWATAVASQVEHTACEAFGLRTGWPWIKITGRVVTNRHRQIGKERGVAVGNLIFRAMQYLISLP